MKLASTITKLLTALLALYSYAPLASAIDHSNCESIGNLGLDNLDRYDYSVDMEIDENCSYALSIKFKHDITLPVPTEPAVQCNPAVQPPVHAIEDGLPYYAFRWAYERVPKSIKKATGIDHISIDFNPCGHPPMDVFTIPHYDFHIYLVDPEYRACMTCDLVPFAPVCDLEHQTTSNGRGFLNVNTVSFGPDAGKPSNMPDNFVVGDMVPLMGGHGWDVSNQPNATDPWVEPVWVMGPYAGTIVDYEPMFPHTFVTGDTSNSYEESLTYVGQTIKELPTSYKLDYDASSKYATLTLHGRSAVCKKDTKAPKGKSPKVKKARKA
jgi:hypothetical protein